MRLEGSGFLAFHAHLSLSLSLSSPIKYKASGHGYNRLLLSCIFLKDVEILIQNLWPYLEIGSWQMIELDEVIGGGC